MRWTGSAPLSSQEGKRMRSLCLGRCSHVFLGSTVGPILFSAPRHDKRERGRCEELLFALAMHISPLPTTGERRRDGAAGVYVFWGAF